ncbi:sigma-70 family RNA polymerase sigma factor [Acinetobacter puyangensis]|uniref:sigma-70 family RNA polymerase sigma factor n=1 Tax=Acinetobacter puyangensis TaxID=1096779 RepID=UPI003A4D746B
MHNTVEHLYQNHHAWLYRWLKSRLKQDCIAADLAQDTFVKLIEHQERYTHYDHPRALLTTIAKNLANQWWRRKKIEQAYQDNLMQLEEQYHPSPEQELMILEALDELASILNNLQGREKQVFMLWQLDGLNYTQIAKQLDVALITIKRDMKKIMLCCLTVLDIED